MVKKCSVSALVKKATIAIKSLRNFELVIALKCVIYEKKFFRKNICVYTYSSMILNKVGGVGIVS